ncbi:MAG TPA: porin [Gemmatimonadales bacterium]|nr:porin [Gemmatimonadales bacterium]
MSRIRPWAIGVASLLGVVPSSVGAQDSVSTPVVAFGAFADAYYAYDFGRPPSGDRVYTTQPARHNEFNVNLAHIEAVLQGERVRGRIALQAGTSVQANYAGEPSRGEISGPEATRFIQEARAGVRLHEGLWLDGGIYFSHIGQESWISRDNPTYSRSLTADYTPYYSAGARLTWQATPSLSVQAHVMNGWQNVSESNGDKAVGLRLEWQAAPRLLVGYDNFIGNELPDSLPAATRVFNEVFARWTPHDGTDLWLTANVGVQDGATWYSATLVARRRLSATVALNARVERYADPDQVVVVTGGADGLEAWGASVGVDVSFAGRALWRTELRGFRGDAPLFPDGSGPLIRDGGFVVGSLAVGF